MGCSPNDNISYAMFTQSTVNRYAKYSIFRLQSSQECLPSEKKPISVPAKVLDVLDNYDNQMKSFSLLDNQHVEITLHLVWVFSIL